MTVPGAGQEPNPSAGQEPGGEQPNAEPQTPPPAGQEPTSEPKPETFSRDYVEQLRKEAADFRKRATAAETKVTEHEREKLSESERLAAQLADQKARADDLESRYRDALIRTAIEREASKAGAIDPEVVYALVDRSEIAFDDDGRVKGAGKVVKALLEAKPYLVAQESTGGARGVQPTGRAGQPAGRDALIEAADKRLAGSGRYAPL